MISTVPASIVGRAPLRISFGGGGTDVPAYYRWYGGFVISAAITRYCTVVATQPSVRQFRITSAEYQCTLTFDPRSTPTPEESLALPKAAIREFAAQGLLDQGVDLFMFADVAPGTGLGSSSAMAVALIQALSAYTGATLDRAEVAELACTLEIERLGMPIGKQDQYASVFGGINRLTFHKQMSNTPATSETGVADVDIRPLPLPDTVVQALTSRLLLFATGKRHDSAQILSRQQSGVRMKEKVIEQLHAIKELARDMETALRAGELDEFGEFLHRAWEVKRRVSSTMSSPEIDAIYTIARAGGALGGKITGAGEGGYLLLYCPEPQQARVRGAMQRAGLAELTFDLDRAGASLLLNTGMPLQHSPVEFGTLVPSDER